MRRHCGVGRGHRYDHLARDELTATGEGSNAQNRFIHWPGTDASGVTL